MYSIKIKHDIVGNEVSLGELNQWIIELDKVLSPTQKLSFRKDLGFVGPVSQEDFEHCIYNSELTLPIETVYKGEKMTIYKN